MKSFRYQISNTSGYISTDVDGNPHIIYNPKLVNPTATTGATILKESLDVMKAAQEYIVANNRESRIYVNHITLKQDQGSFDTINEVLTII